MINYYTGLAYEALRDKEKARVAWNNVINPVSRNLREGVAGGGIAAGGGMGTGGSTGRRVEGSSLAQGEQRYFQALADQKLGNKNKAKEVFEELISSAATALSQITDSSDDSMTAQFRRTNQINCCLAHYTAGLGYAGLGNKKARRNYSRTSRCT